MKQKFFTDTIENKFIQSVLYNFNFPICNAVQKFDWVTRGLTYIYESKLIYCTSTGYLGMPLKVEEYDNTYYYSEGDFCYHNDVLYRCKQTELISENKQFSTDIWEKYVQAQFNTIGKYVFGEKHSQMTYRYTPRYNYYDSETHKMLGEYLRCYKYVKGVDLMPFYNCYNFDTNDSLIIGGDSGTSVVHGYDTSYKVLEVPIKFNKTYTIALDSVSNVKLSCAICTKNGLLQVPVSGAILNPTQLLEDSYSPYMIKSSTSFKQPFTFRIDNKNNHPLTDYNQNISYTDYVTYDDVKQCSACEFLQRYEKYLYLIIQIPSTNNSSIVVLEGDYTSTGVYSIINVPKMHMSTQDNLNSLFLSDLSLLQLNDKESYPISDRLLEYLLQNVIGPNETINNNVNYVQRMLEVNNTTGIIKDVWNDFLRYNLYVNYMNNKWSKKLDFNGLADKDAKYYLENYFWR